MGLSWHTLYVALSIIGVGRVKYKFCLKFNACQMLFSNCNWTMCTDVHCFVYFRFQFWTFRCSVIWIDCFLFIYQCTGVELHVFVGMVLLYIDNTWKHPEGEWITHQRMVAFAPFYLYSCLRRSPYLAKHRGMVRVPWAVHVV